MERESATATIAFVDSGIGGIPYMNHALEHIPQIDGVYLADTAFFPYGQRRPGDLRRRLEGLIAALIERCEPDIVVLACNTASVVALDHLRNTFAIPFVGTVPAIKPAAIRSTSRRIGIMATEQTLKDPYLDQLIGDYAADAQITRLPATGLIEGIERRFFERRDGELLESIGERFADAGADTVVLGCTHFIHLEDELFRRWGDRFQVLDSREGISRQIYRLLNGLPADSYPQLVYSGARRGEDGSQARFFITSRDLESYYRRIAEFFSFRYEGILHER
jgi:glutamate racemase